jgi:hypothetical protein
LSFFGKPRRIAMAEIRKKRADAVLDDPTLMTAAERDKFIAFAELPNNSLEAAKEYLSGAHGIDLSINTISRWLAKKRSEKRDAEFRAHLVEITVATASAQKFEKELADAGMIDSANLALLRKAYHSALILKDVKSIEFFSDKYTQALNAMTSKQRADASLMSAETGREALKLKITTAIDTGLNALFEEVRNIPEAAALFEKIRALVKNAKDVE